MLTTAYYFLQVIICSGLMTGYYWLVLRNKRFHQYNRFYLLIAALLSWAVPLIKIQLNKPEIIEDAQVMQFLYVVADNNTLIDKNLVKPLPGWDLSAMFMILYITISGLLLFLMIHAFIKLYRLLKTHSCKSVGDVYLILTRANGTPFSFFRYIFWNEEIDIRTETGKQILQHELTHVQQKHSIDKVVMQVVLIAGWFNPFFWLMKKEMEMIHEFIADKKAVNNGDSASLAQMLLMAAYPQQKFAMTHPFFFSPIKRRLKMLTNNTNPRFTYLRRLVILPLLAFVTVLFAFRSTGTTDPLSVASVMENVVNTVKETFQDEKPEAATPQNAVLALTEVPQRIILDTLNYSYQNDIELNGKSVAEAIRIKNPGWHNYELIVDGEKMQQGFIETISPGDIESISVIKPKPGQSSTKQLSGIISITTKTRPRIRLTPVSTINSGTLTEIKVAGYPLQNADSGVYMIAGKLLTDQPVIYVDGEKKDWGAVKPSEIAYVRVIKNSDALNKYGMDGKNGVIEITTVKKFSELQPTISSVTQNNITSVASLQNLSVTGRITGGTFSGTLSARTVSGTLVASNIPAGVMLPSFPGGPSAWSKYLDEHLDKDVASRNNAPAGKYIVTVYFMVDPDGKINSLRAENDPGYGTVNAALRVIQKSPKWKPAEVNGKAVHMGYRTTISFSVPPETAGTVTGEQVISVVGYSSRKN